MQAQFSQNIHDFSQEIRCMLKLMAQNDQWKSPSVMWCLSFPDHLWNEHTTTKNAGTEDPRFYRQQRRAARHAKRRLVHGGCKCVGASGWRIGQPASKNALLTGSEQQWDTVEKGDSASIYRHCREVGTVYLCIVIVENRGQCLYV